PAQPAPAPAETPAPPPPSTPVPSTAAPSTAPPSTAPPAVNCGVSDVLFVLDSTGSVSHVYEHQRSYILDVAGSMNIAPEAQHAGLVVYSSKRRQVIVVGLNATKSKEEFLKVVKDVPFFNGVTATGSALSLAKTALEQRRTEKKTLVVVLTDGYSFDDTKAPSDALHGLPNVETIVAGDTEKVSLPVLEEIAGDPSRVLLGEANKQKVISFLKC
ncbi:von Willebrand factor type A domain containing protein, partial [Aphelenchoides avenae]